MLFLCSKGEVHLVIRKVVLASRTREYVDAVLDYVQGSEYSRKFHVTAFSQPEAMMRYMSEQTRASMPDLIVGELEFIELMRDGLDQERVPILLLAEQRSTDGDLPLVMKYQPLFVLLGAWEEAVSNSGTVRLVSKLSGDESLVIGVTSASGGCGKTTVALNLAKQLGRAGYSVFYLNLETLDSTKPFLQTSHQAAREEELEEAFSRLMYLIRARRSGGKASEHRVDIRSYVMWNEQIKSHYFYPARNRNEMRQLTKSDVYALLEVLIESEQYQYIIIDHDSVWDERAEALMDSSNLLIWLLSDDILTLGKASEWVKYQEQLDPTRYAQIQEKSTYVINRYTGTVVNTMPDEYIQTCFYLPYIPSWKQMREPELLLGSPIYQKEMRRLCEAAGILEKEYSL
ncbi:MULTISPECIES: hypothetical protein [unclassified Paenibacillus]|uniref:ParA family protein n=1 Tax=Paenibacillus provencensis TaxID=441151 RepID=A0ABW3PYG4_9BACL|nr:MULTISPECIES: hypothetical protein [unclassified Paenibacillus]MCM3127630.1 ParA family protein [Paenibacillus sp. MER 78]SFS39910.1 AAA domain-containing protein [Paenibacillus sp. 453mf]